MPLEFLRIGFEKISIKMTKKLWQSEYRKKGIPSSFRDTPTRIVKLFAEKYKE